MSRLPTPGSDDNTWGSILNDYLSVSLASDGTVNSAVIGTTQLADNSVTSAKIVDGTIVSADISASAGITKTQLATAVQTSLGLADTALQSTPDATTSTKGGVVLTNDLGGTASAPTTPTAVHLAGTETISGTKTFSATDTNFSTIFGPKAGTTDTNFGFDLPSTVSQRSVAINPYGSATYHDVLAFSKWWGTPTFQTSTDGTTFSAGTLDPTVFASKDSVGPQIIDGATVKGARWIWNNSNVAYSIARTWSLSFTYAATSSNKNITIDSSADGSSWTNRFTASAVSSNASQYWALATEWSGDTYIRLTIVVTNSQPLYMSAIRAYTPRWGNQGGGHEFTMPYNWDNAGNMSIGAGTSYYSNGVLNIGGASPTTAASGIYFGTDTNLYRSASSTLKSDGKIVAAGGLQITTTSAAGQVWTASDTAGNGSWQAAGGSGFGRSINQVTATVTAGAAAQTDYVYWWSGSSAFTLTMPTAVSNTNRYTLKNNSTVAQTISTTASQTIEGGTTISINPGSSVDLISNNTNWMVI